MATASLPDNRGPALPLSLCRAWAGLQCGVSGGVLILAWLVLHSLVRKEYWWARFNVAGGLFYGPEVYHSGVGTATLSGTALLLFYYSLVGVLFGALAARAPRLPIVIQAALFVSLQHAFASYCLWPAMGAFAASWFTWRALLPADLILLVALTRFPAYYRRLAAPPAVGPRPSGRGPQPPNPPHEVAPIPCPGSPPSEDGSPF